MPEIMIKGPKGQIEARYSNCKKKDSPVALILHPHPQYGGTMNNKVVYSLYKTFAAREFSTLRFNFRGVGRSHGVYAGGDGELFDAASALDWLQSNNPNFRSCWIAGFSFGAWIAMRLLMRYSKINRFVLIAPPVNLFDFTFLTPCPISGLVINGDKDDIVSADLVKKLVDKLSMQRDIKISHRVIKGANHFFDSQISNVTQTVNSYLDKNIREIST
ncbi:putative hydrolase of the alpha/beta superfamily protein [Candidatus Endolissoclinum faulkneri L5]|uniref:Putative hydrolase of the alpha/beta superfamily protein n=1 Tax=Candidatus Endolissoclinum faulkneri L5 TaxID=1401328 RepID=V9TR27_9PROT|nr:alpha/beta hydrolase [Candidatus Endolissoclinum faulkneri]AHC73339.1 putative hydrolase of the alpha/beta superfamily protein [Candidatus Endolissoclinum faulkneri L5]